MPTLDEIRKSSPVDPDLRRSCRREYSLRFNCDRTQYSAAVTLRQRLQKRIDVSQYPVADGLRLRHNALIVVRRSPRYSAIAGSPLDSLAVVDIALLAFTTSISPSLLESRRASLLAPPQASEVHRENTTSSLHGHASVNFEVPQLKKRESEDLWIIAVRAPSRGCLSGGRVDGRGNPDSQMRASPERLDYRQACERR